MPESAKRTVRLLNHSHSIFLKSFMIPVRSPAESPESVTSVSDPRSSEAASEDVAMVDDSFVFPAKLSVSMAVAKAEKPVVENIITTEISAASIFAYRLLCFIPYHLCFCFLHSRFFTAFLHQLGWVPPSQRKKQPAILKEALVFWMYASLLLRQNKIYYQ